MSAVEGRRILATGTTSSARRVRDSHALFACLVFLTFCGTVSVAGSPTFGVQLALLVPAVAIGLPHGALDGRNGRRLFAPRHGSRWLAPFLGVYAAFFAATLLIWWVAPPLALSGFLALAVIHFGQCDSLPAGRFLWASILAHGGIPIVVPALAFPDEVARLFGWLIGERNAGMVLGLLAGPAAAAWFAAVTVEIVQAVAEPGTRRNPSELRTSIATSVALLLLFGTVPPTLAFALYFALFHAPRALLQAVDGEGPEPLVAAWRALRAALPLSLASAAIWAGILFALPTDGWAPTTVRSVFMLLSALTVPHMWLEHQLRNNADAAPGSAPVIPKEHA